MISDKTIKETIDRLVDASNPRKLYLFGSYARGNPREKSDLDFLVVEKAVKSPRREMVRLHDSIRSMRIPVDILVVNETVFKEWSETPGSVIYKAVTEGRLCYEQPSIGRETLGFTSNDAC